MVKVEVGLGCDKNEDCAKKRLDTLWETILRDHNCSKKYLPPLNKKLEKGSAATDGHLIYLDPSLFFSKCGDYGTIFDSPAGCYKLLEEIALSDHELGHLEYVERTQEEYVRYSLAVLKGIEKARKKPEPKLVQTIENIISDELDNWRLFKGEVKGKFDHQQLSLWMTKNSYVKSDEYSIYQLHFAIEDELSGGYIGVENPQVEELKREAVGLLWKYKNREKWPLLFKEMAYLFAKNFSKDELMGDSSGQQQSGSTSQGQPGNKQQQNTGKSGVYTPDYTPGPMDPNKFSLPRDVLQDKTFSPEDLQILLDSMNPGGETWGRGKPVPYTKAYTKDTLRLYYRQYCKFINFSKVRVWDSHIVKSGSELWTPEKNLPNIIESVQNPLFIPNKQKIEVDLIPFINIRTNIKSIRKGPDFESQHKPRLLIAQDESESMDLHSYGTKTWYRCIGTMTATRSAVRAGMSCCIVGFSSQDSYHINETDSYSKPWTRNLSILDDAAIHHYNGGTWLPDLGKIADSTKDPVLSTIYTDGQIGNLEEQLSDLEHLTTGKNTAIVFLLGEGGKRNEKLFKSIGAETYCPVDLDDFLFTLNRYTSNIYCGQKGRKSR